MVEVKSCNADGDEVGELSVRSIGEAAAFVSKGSVMVTDADEYVQSGRWAVGEPAGLVPVSGVSTLS